MVTPCAAASLPISYCWIDVNIKYPFGRLPGGILLCVLIMSLDMVFAHSMVGFMIKLYCYGRGKSILLCI